MLMRPEAGSRGVARYPSSWSDRSEFGKQGHLNIQTYVGGALTLVSKEDRRASTSEAKCSNGDSLNTSRQVVTGDSSRSPISIPIICRLLTFDAIETSFPLCRLTQLPVCLRTLFPSGNKVITAFTTSPYKKRRLSPPSTVEDTLNSGNTSSPPSLVLTDPATNPSLSPTIPRHIPPHLALEGARTGRSPTPEPANTAGSSPSGAFAGVTLDSDGYASSTDTLSTNKRRGSLASSGLRGGASSPIRSASPAKRRASEMLKEDVNMDESLENDASHETGATQAMSELKSIPRRGSKNMGSSHRRKTSVDMLAQELDQNSGNSSTSSTSGGEPSEASSASSAAVVDLPSIDEQIKLVTDLARQDMKEGQKGYVVANKWLSRVLARGSEAEKVSTFAKEAREGPIGPVDNTGINLITDPSTGGFKDEAGEPFVPLKPGLTISDDFEILPQAAWDLIIQWYGLLKGSPVIRRHCHNTSTSETQENLQYELHPPVFTILKLPVYDGTTTKSLKERDAAPVRILASRHDLFQNFLRQAKEKACIDLKIKVRVWRLLGGLEKGSQSGMITPAASRSNSPAPGAVLFVDPGDKLVLDLDKFTGLQLGPQRELIDVADQTANEKYNGKGSRLDVVGLLQDEVIVLEEMIGGPAGGEWPSDTAKAKSGSVPISITKSGATIVQNSLKPNANTSRSTSPAPGGMMTRGRQAKNGRMKGTVGLSNLGNTCYMNSALQCVRSAQELTEYFLVDRYKKELNPDNPLSHNGQVAKSYAQLLHDIYSANAVASFAPRQFKNIIGKYGPSFSGYQQQDSQEFLLFLLDGLQEDLNRVLKKPYIEKPDSTDEMVHDLAALKAMADKCWDIYKARNDSVITDLFAGMYKSTVVCPVCDKVSIIFDPFNNLTLQLPIASVWSKKLIVFPLRSKPVIVDVDIDKSASFTALKEYVSARVGIDPKQTMVAELYKHGFYKLFQDNAVIREENIADSDIIGVWEFEDHPTNFPTKKKPQRGYYSASNDEEDIPDDESPVADRVLVPVFHRRLKGGPKAYRTNVIFGTPSFIVVHREERKDYDAILRKVLARTEMMTTRDFLREDSGSEEDTAEDSDTVFVNSDETSETQAKSLEGEDGMVDISMRDGDNERDSSSGTYIRPLIAPTQRSVAPMLRPGSTIAPGVRNLFDMRILPAGKTMIPTGINYISDDPRDYASLSSRRSEVSVHPRTSARDQITQRQSSLTESPMTSDEDEDEVLPTTHIFPPAGDEDSDDDGLPPVEQITQPSIGFSKFNRSTPRNKKGLITYSRKGKYKRGASTRIQASRQASREVTPVENGPLLHLGESLILDWQPDAYDALFDGRDEDDSMRGTTTWEHPPTLPDPEQDEKRKIRTSRRKNGITLEDCLDEFGKPEILSQDDAWYCPRCKEHRRASKTFEIWKAPDILVIHLKRFSSQARMRDKLDVLVDFPIEGLDLSTRLAVHDDEKSPIYDLFAVDNHYGGLGGGHYTAYAQNYYDHAWYEYNDSSVSRRSDPKVVVTSAAYLLFYRRRSSTPLGGPFFEQLLTATDANDSGSQPTSRATSPAGEGRRLDDSSRTGSSSALRGVGAAHQAGGGGSVDGTRALIVRKGIDDDEPAHGLPGYSAQDPRRTMDPNDLQEPTLESMEVDGDEDEGIGMEHNMWHGPVQSGLNGDGTLWRFGSSQGLAPANNSPSLQDDQDEHLSADDSSTKVAKSSISGDDENRMADFNDDEGTTSGAFGTPDQDTLPLLDVPPPLDEIEEGPVAEVMLDDDFQPDFADAPRKSGA